jgi:ribosomal protein L7Ae-like RNA K-turn-binding protein
VKSLIGLAQRAGKLASGEGMVETTIRKGKAKMLILAEDASANTSKMFRNMAVTMQVPLFVHGTKLELGEAIGKSHRSAIAIMDMNFVRGLKVHLSKVEGNRTGEENLGVDQ